MKITYTRIAVAIVGLLSVGCTTDSYDSGDGNYSYLTADFVLLHTDGEASISSADTDDGKHLAISNPFTADWAQKADSVYRALLYYDANKTDGDDDTKRCVVKMRSVRHVPVIYPTTADHVAGINDSPVDVESTWMSGNGKFLNMTLLLKYGKTDDSQAIHTVAVAKGEPYIDADGKRHAVLRLVHDQGNVPQYYTVKQYVSISMGEFADADSVDIGINASSGYINKTLPMSIVTD